MANRLFLLPGFGEDAFIFDELRKYLGDYELIDVNYRDSLDSLSFSNIDVWHHCEALIAAYGITKKDVLIGHSMGGYFSFVIRELIGCEIIMLASFSNPNKVKRIVYKRWFNIGIARLGLMRKAFFQDYLLKPAKGKYFEQELSRVIRNFSTFTTSQLSKMVKMSFGTPIVSTLPNPLRIHAKDDRVVRVPDEAYQECTMGHFCVVLEADIIGGMVLHQLEQFSS